MSPSNQDELSLGTRPRADYPGTEIYSSPIVSIGLFRCPPSHPRFATEGRPRSHIAVFPRTPVRIVHAGGPEVVTDPTIVMLYNRGQQYRREPLCDDGDRCEWFALAPSLLLETIGRHDRSVEERPQAPFQQTHGPTADGVYVLQRAIVEHVVRALRRGSEPDRAWVDEAALDMFQRLLADLLPAPPPPPRMSGATRRARLDLVHRTAELLAVDPARPISIEELAREVGASPFHLCRVFRATVGRTIHDHLTRLRLRFAIERLTDPASDLAAIAVAMGFAHHSHFTATFRRILGITPSELRTAMACPSSATLATRLLAS